VASVAFIGLVSVAHAVPVMPIADANAAIFIHCFVLMYCSLGQAAGR
jgi:hypothetical protein